MRSKIGFLCTSCLLVFIGLILSTNLAFGACTPNITAPNVAVPNVVGQTQAAATTALTGVGLIVGAVTPAGSNTTDLVVTQTPAAGACALPGDAVNLAVAPPTTCLLYTSPSPRDRTRSRMPSSACKNKKKSKQETV
ncbi:MAG TPA: hypothetical protein DIC59_02160, partial [Candidatus Competibacteraceae bacterium]|nr:hypothetical protein [Candidatus Competibacteraceae bacterium]